MKMRRYLILITTLAISLMFLAGSKGNVFADTKEETICNGVYVEEIHLGGMTRTQAVEAIEQYVQGLSDKSLEIVVGEEKREVTLADLGLVCAEFDFVDRALEVGKSGNLIKRYKELKDIEYHSLVFELEFSVNDDNIKSIVENIAGEYNISSKNAAISRKNNEFIIKEHVVGRIVSLDDSINKIKATVTDNLKEEVLTVSLVVVDEIPQYTKEDFEKVNDIIGTFSTTYATSSNSRAVNLANGAKLINGTVLLPGEVFSTYKLLSPYTVDNGYMTAGAYSQGKVIDSIGGGVCQVSTTLYNAVLYSELEVVERSPHSMTISYVDLSRDAALAGDYKDFKFKNNTDVPIFIEAYTVGRKITFNIYGEETRDSARTIKFETEVLSTIKPPAEIVTKDKSLASGTRKVTQTAHYGYKTNCYKIVLENGVEVEKVLINSSTYTASPAYVTIGTKKEVAEKPEKEPKTTDKAKNTDKIKNTDKVKNTDKNNEDDDDTTDDFEEDETEIIDNIEDAFAE